MCVCSICFLGGTADHACCRQALPLLLLTAARVVDVWWGCALRVMQGLTRPASPAVDDWEIDITQLQIDAKVASGAFSNLYRGSYCGQEVAVKILKDVQDDTSQYQEFLQVWAGGGNSRGQTGAQGGGAGRRAALRQAAGPGQVVSEQCSVAGKTVG